MPPDPLAPELTRIEEAINAGRRMRRASDCARSRWSWWVDRLWLLGCAGVAFVVLFVLFAGIIFIASWFKEGL